MTNGRCSNCGYEGDLLGAKHVDSGCLMGLLLGVVRDRGVLEGADIAKGIENLDADAMWNMYGGPAADWIERCLRGEE